jgi:hypothetical protein
LLGRLLDLGHAGHAADQNDVSDFAGGDAGVLQRLAADVDGAVDEIGAELFEGVSRKLAL